jgi:predicted component of type VI protein secretion system
VHAASYAETAAAFELQLALASAADVKPVAAGPYNPLTIAVRALTDLAKLHPGYMRALMAMLADLAAIKPASPPRPPDRTSSRRRGP